MTVYGINSTQHDKETVFTPPAPNRHGKPDAVWTAMIAAQQAERAHTAAADAYERKPGDDTFQALLAAWAVVVEARERHIQAYDAWMYEEDAKAADWADEQAMYGDLRRGG